MGGKICFSKNSKYIEADSEGYLEGKYLGNPFSTTDKIAVVGNDGDYSFEALKDIFNERDIRYTNEYKSFSKIREHISKFDSQSETNISHAIQLDHIKDSKEINLNVLKSDFSSPFTPFNLDRKDPISYDYDKYVGFNDEYFDFNYLGNYASLIAEKIANDTGSPLRIKAGYLQRSSEPFRKTDLSNLMDQLYSVLVILIFLLPYMYILQRAVQEKSDKTRENMRMMGMLESSYWSSWFLLYTIQVFYTSVVLTLGSSFTLFKG